MPLSDCPSPQPHWASKLAFSGTLPVPCSNSPLSGCPSHKQACMCACSSPNVLMPVLEGRLCSWRQSLFTRQSVPRRVWSQLVFQALACHELAASHGDSALLLVSIVCRALHWRRGLESSVQVYKHFHPVEGSCDITQQYCKPSFPSVRPSGAGEHPSAG